jgi:1,4-dihydroxy-6-naphthoate synthase
VFLLWGVPITLSLAHSPDPDDVFMWWPITGMIDPPRDAQRVEPARVISRPELDTGGVRFTSIATDIAVLNRRAIDVGDLDITAISMFAWASVRSKYQLTSFGSSFGEGYGPRVVARATSPERERAGERHVSKTEGSKGPVACAPGSLKNALVAVPGTKTTAFLLLSMFAGAGSFRCVEMPFDRVLNAVATGEGGVTHGLLIHQSQLTFAELGLELLVDLGAWWGGTTGLPLPLGGNAVRRDLDQRFKPGLSQHVANIMDRSVRYALEHRQRSIEYAMRFAPELSRAGAEKYIDMYVSPLTVECGQRGESAIERLLSEAARQGMSERVERVDLLRPGGLA